VATMVHQETEEGPFIQKIVAMNVGVEDIMREIAHSTAEAVNVADQGATAVRALVVVRLVPVAALPALVHVPLTVARDPDHDPNPVIVDPKAHRFVVGQGSRWTDLDPVPVHPVIANPNRVVVSVPTHALARAVGAGPSKEVLAAPVLMPTVTIEELQAMTRDILNHGKFISFSSHFFYSFWAPLPI